MKKITSKKRRTYKANERRERLRIYELYDGPTTDMQGAIRTMDQIHKWIKNGDLPPRDDLKIRRPTPVANDHQK